MDVKESIKWTLLRFISCKRKQYPMSYKLPIDSNLNDLEYFQFFEHTFEIEKFAHSEGVLVMDNFEERWIDLSMGGLGYNHPTIVEAARLQIQTLPLSSRMFFSSHLAKFIKKLVSVLPQSLNVAYPCNSPAEAVEGAIKLAKGFLPKRPQIIAFENGYHGNTWGTMSVCGIARVRNTINHFPLQVNFLSFGNLLQLEEYDFSQSSCVILEPISAMLTTAILPNNNYLERLRKKCTETQTLLIINESLIGIGNCGAWTWCEMTGINPDILILGNALGAGLMPAGVYIARRIINDKVYGKAHPALHGGTTAGNPLMCSIGEALIEVIKRDNLILKTNLRSKIIQTFINNLTGFNIPTFHIGIIAVLQFPNKDIVNGVINDCQQKNILLTPFPGSESILFINPPLLISDIALKYSLMCLYNSIQNNFKKYLYPIDYETLRNH